MDHRNRFPSYALTDDFFHEPSSRIPPGSKHKKKAANCQDLKEKYPIQIWSTQISSDGTSFGWRIPCVKSLVVGQGFQNARNHGGSHDLKANRPRRVSVEGVGEFVFARGSPDKQQEKRKYWECCRLKIDTFLYVILFKDPHNIKRHLVLLCPNNTW